MESSATAHYFVELFESLTTILSCRLTLSFHHGYVSSFCKIDRSRSINFDELFLLANKYSAQPVTTVVPFASLPSCAVRCGPLYDANGACVPPAAAQADETTYDSCFCKYDSLQPFSKGTSGVCDSACTDNAAGLSSIQGWFTSFCAKAATATTSSSSSTSTSTSGSSSSNSGGGDWYVFLKWHFDLPQILISNIIGSRHTGNGLS